MPESKVQRAPDGALLETLRAYHDEAQRLADGAIKSVVDAVGAAAEAGAIIADLVARCGDERAEWLRGQLDKLGIDAETAARYQSAHRKLAAGELEPGMRMFQLAGIAPVNDAPTPPPAKTGDWLRYAAKLMALVGKLPQSGLRDLHHFHRKEAERIEKLLR